MHVARFIALSLVLSVAAPQLARGATDTPLQIKPTKLKLGKQVFGTIGATSAPKLVTLANTGTDTIALNAITVQGDFALGASTCGPGLGPGAKCTLAVTFTPTALGTRTGQLTVTDDAPGSPHTVALTGTGVLGKLVFAPSSLAFPARAPGASGAPRFLTIQNENAVPIRITKIVVSGDDFAPDARTCGSVLGAGASCTVGVQFVPHGSGARKGLLRIAAQAAKSPKSVALKGKSLGKCKDGAPDFCGGVCTNVKNDPDNCGACENSCAGTCIDGKCVDATISCRNATPDLCDCGDATTCVDFGRDPENCGGCGNACYVGQHCVGGACVGCTSVSAPDECGTVCTNFQGDPLNCGACGVECASGRCAFGACLACAADAPTQCGGVCTNVLTDEANCGGCGNVCPAGTSCGAGQCAGITCGGATPDQCGNRCTNLLADAQHCGSCATACGGGACVQGECVTCGAGTPDRCGASCTNVATDDDNCGGCGNVCPTGASCSGGKCVAGTCTAPSLTAASTSDATTEPTSAAGPLGAAAAAITCGGDKPTLCGSECVNLSTDSFHCGSCDTFCPGGNCVGGSCIECTAAAPSICGSGCADFFNDGSNCGGCGIGCPTGDGCVGGVCQRATNCGGENKNIDIDPLNCGGCGIVCPGGKCVDRKCASIKCPGSGDIVCNGICTNRFVDSFNCGTCGHVCTDDTVCAGTTTTIDPTCSKCADPAPDDCNGLCVNLRLDPNHCGTCSTKCGDDEECAGGHCEKCSQAVTGSNIRCGLFCAVPTVDARNCGACGNNCGVNAYCFNGQCADCSQFAPTQCGRIGNRCTNLESDAKNCGACDRACDKGQRCIDGKCKTCIAAATEAALGAPRADDVCFIDCGGTTPDACGTECVDTRTDPNNCGGCGNQCGPFACNQGECDPGFCGTYKATAWDGSVTETSTDLCGGAVTLSLGAESTFTLTPSTTIPGGCDVGGGANLLESGVLGCGPFWGGLWSCGGTVDTGGAMHLGCSCNTAMTVNGTFASDGFSGNWSFSLSGEDDNGGTATDSGAGSFTLQRVSP